VEAQEKDNRREHKEEQVLPREGSHELHAMEYMSRTRLKSRSQSDSTDTLEERLDLSIVVEDVSQQLVVLLFRAGAPWQERLERSGHARGEDEAP
jgi:hypothetical protein